MPSLILSTATRALFPLLLLFSLFVLVRGHNEPGGGFVGGLVAAMAWALLGLAESPAVIRRRLRIPPPMLASLGLTVAAGSGIVAWGQGRPFFTGIWSHLPVIGDGGTPMLFDVGVYMVVLGVTLTILLELWED